MKVVLIAATFASLLCACSESAPQVEILRPVNTVELRYDSVREANRYFAAVASRYEVDQAFRVGGKVHERKVDVGLSVKTGDVLAVLDDGDYRLAEEAAQQRLAAAQAQAQQAESDWQRLQALKLDGSVSAAEEERAQSSLLAARAAAAAEARQLELARNQVEYTVLRAPIDGVVTSLRFEIGQVVAPGQPVIAIANEGDAEIIADIPENHLEAFKTAQYKVSLARAPDEYFDVVLRELSAQAASQTRTYRARLRPATARLLPLGATATVVAEHGSTGTPAAALPAAAITQSQGQPAVWIALPEESGATATVELVNITVHGYRNDEVLVSGPPAGTLVVTAGVQKMAPGLRVTLSGATNTLIATREALQ